MAHRTLCFINACALWPVSPGAGPRAPLVVCGSLTHAQRAWMGWVRALAAHACGMACPRLAVALTHFWTSTFCLNFKCKSALHCKRSQSPPPLVAGVHVQVARAQTRTCGRSCRDAPECPGGPTWPPAPADPVGTSVHLKAFEPGARHTSSRPAVAGAALRGGPPSPRGGAWGSRAAGRHGAQRTLPGCQRCG